MKEKYFYEDGSLRDVYCFNTGLEDWQALVNYFENNYRVTRIVDGEDIKDKFDIAEILQKEKKHAYTMVIHLDLISINTHFFLENEIELDIDPKEIRSKVEIDVIFKFIKKIGILLNKNIYLTDENLEEKEATEKYLVKWDRNKQELIFS